MSSGDQPLVVRNDEAYNINRERIQQMQELLNNANAVNEQGKRNYDQMANELKRRIQEGENAQRMLAALQSGQPLLTFHEAEAPTSNPRLLSYTPPPHASTAPSARIEEVPSPSHSNVKNSGNYHQPPQGNEDVVYQSYQQPRSNTHFSAASSSTLNGALGQASQAQQSQYSHMAPQPTYQSSSRYSQPRETPPFVPQQQTVHSDSRQSQSFGANSQSNPRAQPYSQQREPNASGSTQYSNPQTSSRPPTQTHAQAYSQQDLHPSGVPPQLNYRSQAPPQGRPSVNGNSVQSTLSFKAPSHLNSRQSQPRETPPPAPSRQPDPQPRMQPQHQPAAQPNPPRQTRSQSGQLTAPIQSNHQTQSRSPPPSNSQPQAPPPSQPSLQSNSRPQPQAQAHSQTQPQIQLPVLPTQANSQQSSARAPADSQQRGAQRSGAAPQAPSAAPQPPLKSVTSTTAPASTPSYGISPFAHVPASAPGPAPQKPNTSAQKSITSTEPVRKPAPSNVASNAASSFDRATVSNSDRYKTFLQLIDTWQRASPPDSQMDIPHAQIRVIKFPTGEIHFFYHGQIAEETRISPMTAFSLLRFNAFASIFLGSKGVPTMLLDPLPSAMAATYTRFQGTTPKNAPHATFPDPPPFTPAPRASVSTRAPQDVDKRFLAHDVLRALGKSRLYPEDEESVRYAKRRALEAPELEQSPFVARVIGSNESSARTTPEAISAVPMAVQRVPLFLPQNDSPSPVPVKRRAPPVARPASPKFYVLVPPTPSYVRRYQARMRAHKLHEVKMEPEPEVEVPVEVDVEAPMQQEEEEEEEVVEPEVEAKELRRRRALGMYQTTENEAEAAAMLDACSRMREMPCKWFACGSVLNSLENVVTHLHEVHAQEDADEVSTCMWDICGETFPDWRQVALHAETHVLDRIHCAHQDCEEVLSSPSELVAHNRGHAGENSAPELKPSARPSAPQEPLPLPVVPQSVPMCMVFAPGVQMPGISEERHATLGPWILRNVCAPANVRAKRAAAPLRSGGKVPDYELVETSARHYSCLPSRPAKVREMTDLDSREVSDMLANGKLVLWPPEGGAHKLGDMVKLEGGEDKLDHVGEVEGGADKLDDNAKSESGAEKLHDIVKPVEQEEQAVEDMLVDVVNVVTLDEAAPAQNVA